MQPRATSHEYSKDVHWGNKVTISHTIEIGRQNQSAHRDEIDLLEAQNSFTL
jgi:hypothetical protein